MSTRRSFLKSAASAATLYLSSTSHAENNSKSETSEKEQNPIIDTHAHWTGPTVVKLLQQRTTAPRYVTNEKGELVLVTRGSQPTGRERGQAASWFSLEERLKHLDEAGVSQQVLSWTGATYEGNLSPEEAKPFWQAQNNDIGDAVRKYSRHFIGLATLPTSNPQAAAVELKRAHEELGLNGATLPLDAFIHLDSARYLAPIFIEAQKHKSHIFIHRGLVSPNVPHATTEVGATNTYFGLASSEGPNERPKPVEGDDVVARATLITSTHLAAGVITLALSDFLVPYPDVTVQIAMIGGSISYVAEQISFAKEAAGKDDTVSKLRRIYYDTGQFGRGSKNIAHAARVLGPDRILFGSDYGPQGSILPYIQGVKDAPISDPEKQQILYANAERIFGER